MKIYDYFRSSAAYRLRIALSFKGVAAEQSAVHLRRGEQRDPAYLAVNNQGLVPALVTDNGAVLTQSLAIIEYLDETHPLPPLLPPDAEGRARVRSIALTIACEIHPLANLRVLRYLLHTLGVTEAQKDTWYLHWVTEGLGVLEARLARESATGRFCHGDTPTLADVVLVPQLANARRVNADLAPYPTLTRIDAACRALPAFANAAPELQPDAE